MSPTSLITTLKSITAKEIFKKHPEVKTKLWGGEFWTDGFFVNTVSKFGDETSITKYVRDQGLQKEYTVLHSSKQLALF
jgi:REP element-mobilizing transposase RayT